MVDEAALVQALRERWIAGAGLDVFEDEPRLAPGLQELENVVLAPHIASEPARTSGASWRWPCRSLAAIRIDTSGCSRLPQSRSDASQITIRAAGIA